MSNRIKRITVNFKTNTVVWHSACGAQTPNSLAEASRTAVKPYLGDLLPVNDYAPIATENLIARTDFVRNSTGYAIIKD